MKTSTNNIEISNTIKDNFIFLKKQPLIIATATIGVKLGGWGSSLEKANNKIKLIGKISFCSIFVKFFIRARIPFLYQN